ncbi:Uncharacterised protein [Enterobacter hormaechei]|nr:Uncharacterised protein [Enterobacter hormaechei]SAA47804.1 Uncharacterised protein [Enterobacter hormaechei]SAA98211.1 Uncharacterised protein [Enterobacter hormaechei]
MEAVTAVRYVNSAIFAGVTGERIYERTQEKRPLARPKRRLWCWRSPTVAFSKYLPFGFFGLNIW